MSDESRVRQQRSVFVSVVLTVFFGSGALFLSFLLCGGLSIYMLAVIGGFAAMGYLHYLLWGHSMAHEVRGELEREQRDGELQDEAWNWQEPPRGGRL